MGLDHGIYIKKKGRGNKEKEYIATFRKCNQIHNWFLTKKNLDPDSFNGDSGEVKVSYEDLLELYSTVDAVIQKTKLRPGFVVNGCKFVNLFKKTFKVKLYGLGKKIANPGVAKKLLPTKEGFFWGSCDYDLIYLDQLTWAKEELAKVLEIMEDGEHNAFYWCWW